MATQHKRRRYSDNDKATALAALDANGGNVAVTAKQTGIPRTTLIEWNDGRVIPEVSELRHIKKEELADIYEDVTRLYLDRARDKSAIENTSGNAAILAAATATDKMRLLRGLPTEIVQVTAKIMQAAEEAGYNPSDLLNDLHQELIAAKANPTTQDGEYVQ